MGAEPRPVLDALSISRDVYKSALDANANPSHLLLTSPNRILRRVIPANPSAAASISLADLRAGEIATVSGLAPDTGGDAERGALDTMLARLRDLGFVAGARCEVVARMWLGGDPLAVRIGGSTFALRRAEAAAVRVQRLAVPQGVDAAAA